MQIVNSARLLGRLRTRSAASTGRRPYPAWLAGEARSSRIRGRFAALTWDDVPGQLSARSRVYLRHALIPLAQRVFDCTSRQFWLDWLSDASLNQLKRLILVYNDTGELIGWAASSHFEVQGRQCFYASSAGVHPTYQGQGITSTTARRLFMPALWAAAPRTLYTVVRTGNPLVYSAWQAASVGRREVFPCVSGRHPPALIGDIAVEAARRLDPNHALEASTLIMRDAYDSRTDGLWSARPGCDQDQVCRWFDQTLGAHDAVIMVVPFEPLAMFAKESMRQLRLRSGRKTTDSARRASP